jgi:hypothetical protein
MRIAAVYGGREGWKVKNIVSCISFSGSAETKNCEGLESVFPWGLVGLSRVTKVVPVYGLGTLALIHACSGNGVSNVYVVW